LKAVLAVFLKAPAPGAVKTRLVPALGPEAAAGLYRALAEAVVERTRPHGEYERLLFFTPAEARAEMEAWLPGEAWIAQQGLDLGARMAAAFDEAFRRGADRVALVGSDVPGLACGDVVAALDSLADHDLALGPAADGGYYLVALGQPRPELFQGMAWGTGAVFAATMERAAALGLTVRVLEERSDIDTAGDVRAQWRGLRPLLARELADTIENALGLPSRDPRAAS
jgi:rSAM/selenodomain-associated transferase 1